MSGVHPFEKALILGGTRVHDWFLVHHAIDRVHLTIEPITFGDGLPVFSAQISQDPVEIFDHAGFEVDNETVLNDAGTRYLTACRKWPISWHSRMNINGPLYDSPIPTNSPYRHKKLFC